MPSPVAERCRKVRRDKAARWAALAWKKRESLQFMSFRNAAATWTKVLAAIFPYGSEFLRGGVPAACPAREVC
jgi:hypothetical protein